MYVQSDENVFFEVFKVPKTISVPFDNLNQVVAYFKCKLVYIVPFLFTVQLE